jgi:hypothetical protein
VKLVQNLSAIKEIKKEFIAREKNVCRKNMRSITYLFFPKKKKKNTQKSEGDGEKKDTCLLLGGPMQRQNCQNRKS